MAIRKRSRHRLLLDEGLPRREAYPQANNYHNLKHIAHDLNLSGAKDKDVYAVANKEQRLIVVFNTKDFRSMISSESISVVSLSTNLTDHQVDLKLCRELRKLRPSQLKGHLITITNNNATITRVNP